MSIQHDEPVISVTFSPDGSQVAYLDGNRPVTLSLVHQEDLINAVCLRLTRNLTQAEWQQYIGNTLPYERTCPNLPEGGE